MSQATIGGKTGNVSFISGHGAAFDSWSMDFDHPVADTTNFGSGTNSGSSHFGSGISDYNLSVSGFIVKGAAGNSPGFDDITTTGASVTCTADTGCTEAGTFIVRTGRIDVMKRNARNNVAFTAINDGNVTETWAVA